MPNKGGFSWKRVTGVTRAKQKISRTTDIPLTKSSRKQKIGKIVTGGGWVINTILIALFAIGITTAIATDTQYYTYLPIIMKGGTTPIDGNIDIINIFYDGSEIGESDEYVEIKNIGTTSVQVQNWTIRDIADHVFTFPAFVMEPNQICRIYTNQDHPEFCGFNYHWDTPIWNNTGDCAYLINSTGTLKDTYCYTTIPIDGNIDIIDIFYDGSEIGESDEYVEIKNIGTTSVQVQNWTIRDIADHVFTFPAFVMEPNQICRIYTNQDHPEFCGFNYHWDTPIWNNTGDCAYLINSTGTLKDTYCY